MNLREMATREEKRQAFATAAIALEAEEIAGGTATYGGAGSWINQAAGLGLDGPVTEAEIDRLVAFFVQRDVEPTIEVCPFAHESLLQGLARRHFTVSFFENVFVRQLQTGDAFDARLEHGWPEGLDLQRIDPSKPEQVRAFADASTVGFRPPGEALSEVALSYVEGMARQEGCQCYLALLDGAPVGGGALGIEDGLAVLMGTSVEPRYRRRGIQQALLARRLDAAREAGAELAFIHAEPGIGTERNAMRMGFALAYTKVCLTQRQASAI